MIFSECFSFDSAVDKDGLVLLMLNAGNMAKHKRPVSKMMLIRQPNSSIKIINRWGNVVYEAENGYLNDWDGTSNAELTIGSNELPTGTYFYILELNDDGFEGDQTYKGYVYLQR